MADSRLRVVDDGWKLEGATKYDPNAFYIGTRNGYDHSARSTVYLRPELQAAILEMIGTRVIPEYKTFQDVVRDALHHRMEALRTVVNTPEFEEIVRDERRRATKAKFERKMKEMTDEVASLEETLKQAWQCNDNETLAGVINEYETQLEDFREPYRNQIEQLIKRFSK